MDKVMIRCPQTGLPIFTGLTVSQGAKPDKAVTAVGCPRCGDLHIWSHAEVLPAGADTDEQPSDSVLSPPRCNGA